MAQLSLLKTKRTVKKGQLTRAENFFKKYEEGDDVALIQTKLNTLSNLLDDFIEIQTQIEATEVELLEGSDDDQSKAQKAQEWSDKTDQEIYDFEQRHCLLITAMQNVIDKKQASSIETRSLNTNSNHTRPLNANFTQTNLKLPAIHLPQYKGDYKDWTPFKDAFISLIHENKSISQLEKLHYLKSSLKESALKVIDALPVTNSSYEVAWDLICKRYDNHRLIVNGYVTALMNAPIIQKPTYTALRALLDQVTNHTEALKSQRIPIEHWDAILIPIVAEKLDFVTHRDWETTLEDEIPKLETLLTFIDKKCNVLQSLEANNRMTPTSATENKNKYYQKPRRVTCSIATQRNNNISCNFCKKSHLMFQCEEFLKLSIQDRRQNINKLKLCANCFRNNHKTHECLVSKCRICRLPHNTLIHENKADLLPNENDLQEDKSKSVEQTTLNVNHCYSTLGNKQVLLSTAVVNILDSNGIPHKCRAFFDTGSQITLVSRDLITKLKIATKPSQIPVAGINNLTCNIKQMAQVIIVSRINGDFTITLDCAVVDQVTQDLPTTSFDNTKIALPKGIELADPGFNETKRVDLLLSADVFWELIDQGQIITCNKSVRLINTPLGYIVGGSIPQIKKKACNSILCNHASLMSDDNLDRKVSKFWTQEEPFNEKQWTNTEIQCENHFKNTYRRDPQTGRFIVKLPFKHDRELGNSYEIALKRFNLLEQRFRKNNKLRAEYNEVMQEYQDLDHMEIVPEAEIDNKNSFYLPHQAVYKEASVTTKIRIVFDGSSKSTNGRSLNDVLLNGPLLQSDLITVLCRFRTYQYVFSCDITKMYRQIKLDKHDSNYQRVLWRRDPEKDVQVFRIKTVCFGITSSAYQAIRCVQQLPTENVDTYPKASQALLKDLYVDDLCSGADSIEEAINLRNQCEQILEQGGFKLSKWAANHSKLIPNSYGNKSCVINFDKDGMSKALGLFWNCNQDILNYKIKEEFQTQPLTKRTCLSIVAQLFDPLGLVAPVITRAKILMQQLWSEKLGWDDPIPDELQKAFTSFIIAMPQIQEIVIPRKLIESISCHYELCAFSDASIQAYGTCVYLRSRDAFGNFRTSLAISKSRVAPIKTISLPRLELNGAVLSVQAVEKLRKILPFPIAGCYFFVDSTIVLHWISRDANQWQTYVANRIGYIQNSTQTHDWYHIQSEQNPADLVSRGTCPEQLKSNQLWWNAPAWMARNSENWEATHIHEVMSKSKITNVPERRNTVTITNTIIEDKKEFQLFHKYSSFFKLQRVIAYCQRFIYNAKNPNQKRLGFLTTLELTKSHNTIIKIVQLQEFKAEINSLNNDKEVTRTSKTKKLNPFLDPEGLLRVGGRLRLGSFNTNKKHPLILPKANHVTSLIIQAEHIRNLHAGPQLTLYSIRERYWPLGGRNSVRQVIHKCITCFKCKPRFINQQMGDLPKARITQTRPFTVTGVDYMGPFSLREGNKRSRKTIKSYVALFICFVTKAIHLELVTDLSSECFLSALKRLIARRGYVSELHCDNATNFIGARNELQKMFKQCQDQISQSKDLHTIEFHMIPPRSPTFGGLWERSVQSVKFHLKRVVGDAVLSYEEMYTFITQIESILNSRPITPLTPDLDHYEALTPGHFLIGQPLNEIKQPDVSNVPTNRLTRWRMLEKIRQQFWKRFHKEYLNQLQMRNKWSNKPTAEQQQQIKVGSMVMLADDNLPPLRWPLGRIIEVHPGPDGIIRVLSIRTKNGIVKRATGRVCFLPVEEVEVDASRGPVCSRQNVTLQNDKRETCAPTE